MTQRLPVPGSDDGTWGTILNDFLGISHNADGTLAANTVGSAQIQSGSVSSSKLDTQSQTNMAAAATAVQSVNGKTGTAVTLAAGDVGAVGVASPAFTGTPTAPTAAPGTNTTQLATTAFTTSAVGALSGTYVPLAGGTLTGALFGQFSGDANPRFALSSSGILDISSPYTPLNYGTHDTGNVGNGTDFQVSLEWLSDTARLLNLRAPRFYLTDGNGNYFHLSANGWSGNTLNSSLSLVCDAGSFASLAASGTMTINQTAYGSGVISYTSVTGSGGVGTSGTLNGTTVASGTISPANTDTSARWLFRAADTYGAAIAGLLNYGGLVVNDQITFNYAGVGSTSTSDIIMGFFNNVTRNTGSAVFYGTDGQYVYTYRTNAFGNNQYITVADGHVLTWSLNGLYPGTALNLGTTGNKWGIAYIGQALGGTGSATTPIFGFSADTQTGLYSGGASSGVIGVTSLGNNIATWSASGLAMANPIAMGSNKITGLANGSVSTDAAAFGQIASAINAIVPTSGAASPTAVGPTPDLRPTGWTSESAPRGLMASATVPAAGATGSTGTLRMTAVYLAAGTVVNNLNVLIGSTGATAPTHFWMGLYDNNRVQLATTADQGSAAINANTPYILPIATIASGSATSFTTTYSGLHYVGVLIIATTTLPTMVGPTSSIAGEFAINLPPILSGTSDTATGAAPGFPHTAASLSASVMVYVGTS